MQRTLRDIAYAFHGVTSVHIFSSKKETAGAKGVADTLPCRVIYQSDIAHQGPWRDPDGIRQEKVSRRFIEEDRRGLGQKSTLMPGDILITTRGYPYVSPLVTARVLAGGAMVAGPDTIVVRAKQPWDAAIVRKTLLGREAALFFKDKSPKIPKNQARVLPKSVIMNLAIPDELEKLKYSFDDRLEAHAADAEAASERMATISRAFVESARWRSELDLEAGNERFDYDQTAAFSWEKRATEIEHDIARRCGAAHQAILDAMPIGEIGKKADWTWKKPFDEEYEELWASKDQWASEGIVRCLDDIANGRLDSDDSKLLCRLLSGGSDCARARSAMSADPQLILNTTLLLHQGHHSASSMNVRRSVRRLLASCVRGMDKVLVLSAEAGHQAIEVVTDTEPPRHVGLVESRPPYRNVAAALCRFLSPGIGVETANAVSGACVGEKINAAILEASGFDAEIEDGKLDGASRQLFDWDNLHWRFHEGGKMFAHLPTSHWKLLSGIKANVSAIVQLPPLIVPAYQSFVSRRNSGSEHTPRDRHTRCDQGIIVVIEPGWGRGGDVRVIDATMLTGGDAVTELTQYQLDILRDVIMHNNLSHNGLRCMSLAREKLFHNPTTWPGMAKYMAPRASSQELAEDFTLETLVEEMQFRYRAWMYSQDALLSHVGIRLKI